MKTHFLITFFALMLFAIYTHAQQITYHQARTAAINFLKYEGQYISEDQVDTIMTKQANGHILIYEVLFLDKTRILLSGHNGCTPILGMIDDNWQNEKTSLFVDIEQCPPAFQELLMQYESLIQSCFDNHSDFALHSEWNKLLVYDPTIQDRTIIIDALLSSQWGQKESNDNNNPANYAYNYYVHNNNNCTNSPAGCVAVAMGQILRYWSDKGIYVYNPNLCWEYLWNNMPNELLYQNGNNANYEAQRNAVAALLRDCGTCVGMEYSCESSGIHVDSSYAICRGFRSYGFLSYLQEKSSVSEYVWGQLVRENLDNECPILYLGIGTGGHAFVCDGYKSAINTSYKYHFNWGWSGRYDGWFTLDDLTPGATNYTNSQKAIFNIHPSTCWENIIFGCDKHFAYNNTSYSSEETIQNDGHIFSVQHEAVVTLKAGEEIILTDGFSASNGGKFVAEIEDCEPDESEVGSDDALMTETRRLTNTHHTLSNPKHLLTLSPNPTNNTVTLQLADPQDKIRQITVVNMQGQVVLSLAVNATTPYTLDISSLPAGIYVVRVLTANGTVATAKVVKE